MNNNDELLSDACKFAETMIESADKWDGIAPLWYRWALREAFIAGAQWAGNNTAGAKVARQDLPTTGTVAQIPDDIPSTADSFKEEWQPDSRKQRRNKMNTMQLRNMLNLTIIEIDDVLYKNQLTEQQRGVLGGIRELLAQAVALLV